MKFEELKIIKPILYSLEEKDYKEPTEIQKLAIPALLNKKDLLGCAQTGTGKTAAFAIPIIQMLHENSVVEGPKKVRALILTPTRELALQIRDNFRFYAKNTDLTCSVIFGGVNQQSQINVLKKGVDILVATPGRLLDLINQRHAKLGSVEYLVLDEADTMLDMGFIHDVKKIVNTLNNERQTMLFSATMPNEIKKLAKEFLKNHVEVTAAPVSSTAPKIEQMIYHVNKKNKNDLILSILGRQNMKPVLVFTRTKHGANKLTDFLNDYGVKSIAIHGNKSQGARVTALSNFKSGKVDVLVATDIAARGIDIKELPYVINYDIPEKAESYVHRIGRTGRAGQIGTAISLCDPEELRNLKDIEKLIKKEINVVLDHDFQVSDVREQQPRQNREKSTLTRKQMVFENKNKSNNNQNRSNDRKNNFDSVRSDDSYGTERTSKFDNRKSNNYSNKNKSNTYGDRSKTSRFGDKPQSSTYGDRPKASRFGDKPKSSTYGDRPKASGYGDKTKSSTYGDRPKASGFGDKKKSTGFNENKKPSSFGSRGKSTSRGSFGKPSSKNSFNKTSNFKKGTSNRRGSK